MGRWGGTWKVVAVGHSWDEQPDQKQDDSEHDQSVSPGVAPIECRRISALGVSPYWPSPVPMPKGLRGRGDGERHVQFFLQFPWGVAGKESEHLKIVRSNASNFRVPGI